MQAEPRRVDRFDSCRVEVESMKDTVEGSPMAFDWTLCSAFNYGACWVAGVEGG